MRTNPHNTHNRLVVPPVNNADVDEHGRVPEDVHPTEWSADHVPISLADTNQGDVLADGVTAANE